jgi:hypothetical protein
MRALTKKFGASHGLKTLLKNTGDLMKKLFIGVLVLSSLSAFAETEKCNVALKVDVHQDFYDGGIEENSSLQRSLRGKISKNLVKKGYVITSLDQASSVIDVLVETRNNHIIFDGNGYNSVTITQTSEDGSTLFHQTIDEGFTAGILLGVGKAVKSTSRVDRILSALKNCTL